MRLILTCCLLILAGGMPAGFKSSQMNHTRVRDAYKEKGPVVSAILAERKIDPARMELFIRVFKQEKLLQVWGRNRGEPFVHLKNYTICASSGTLGPKRRQGDLQVPEGFYVIDRFNPASNFYLSLGISYPNRADRIRAGNANPGGDIFIHGNCVTIGCIPLTDDKIKELYVLAVEAKEAGQKAIPVHIFPTALTEERFRVLAEEHASDPTLVNFWRNLKVGYQSFETSRMLPVVTVRTDGQYEIMSNEQ